MYNNYYTLFYVPINIFNGDDTLGEIKSQHNSHLVLRLVEHNKV